jgi:hypothetical protein
MTEKQTLLKFIRFFMSRNTFTKLEFYDSLILTENALKLTYVHLNFQKFWGLYTGPFFTASRGNEEGDSWERRVRDGRGIDVPLSRRNYKPRRRRNFFKPPPPKKF